MGTQQPEGASCPLVYHSIGIFVSSQGIERMHECHASVDRWAKGQVDLDAEQVGISWVVVMFYVSDSKEK